MGKNDIAANHAQPTLHHSTIYARTAPRRRMGKNDTAANHPPQSTKRYFSSVQKAIGASLQPIFLPS
jgi:hypothetical protein